MADKLAGIADAVGTVIWPQVEGAPKDSPKFTYQPGDPGSLVLAEWDIPPQSDSDRFIVRDLAIHSLAMLPALDAYADLDFPSGMPQNATCSTAWAWLSNSANTQNNLTAGSCIDPTISNFMFGFAPSYQTEAGTTAYINPFFPPSTLPLCDGTNNNAPLVAQTALDVEAQILRSSGRLLHDLIRRDVYSDLASAAQQAAQALDPVRGNLDAGASPTRAAGEGPHTEPFRTRRAFF